MGYRQETGSAPLRGMGLEVGDWQIGRADSEYAAAMLHYNLRELQHYFVDLFLYDL